MRLVNVRQCGKIQIHLMLLLILRLRDTGDNINIIQIHLMLLLIMQPTTTTKAYTDSNTSHVTINRQIC